MKILPESAQISRKGPEAWFTGQVWIDEIVTAAAPAKFKAVRVSFAPCARTAWHTHPLGQALNILAGVGLIQVKGGPIREMRRGDSVWIEAGEVHWHGAALEHTMCHMAVLQTDDHGADVVWMEHVTDEEYSAALG